MCDEESFANELLGHHFVYEVDMLRGTYNRIGQSTDQVLENVMIESFCLHARNLIEFFESNKGAKKFVEDGYDPFLGKAGEVKTIKRRLNGQITHLIYERTADDSKKINGHERGSILNLIANELEVFKAKVKPKYKLIAVPDLSTVLEIHALPGASSSVTSSTVMNFAPVNVTPTGPTGGRH